jgi:hypothetical protein
MLNSGKGGEVRPLGGGDLVGRRWTANSLCMECTMKEHGARQLGANNHIGMLCHEWSWIAHCLVQVVASCLLVGVRLAMDTALAAMLCSDSVLEAAAKMCAAQLVCALCTDPLTSLILQPTGGGPLDILMGMHEVPDVPTTARQAAQRALWQLAGHAATSDKVILVQGSKVSL